MVATENKINTGMLVLARESRGYSQKEMADLIDISAAKLSRVESGEQNISEEQFTKLITHLGYPRSFYYQQNDAIISSHLSFRQRQKVPQKLLSPVEALINVYRLNVEALFKGLQKTLPAIPNLDITELGSAQEAAKKLRKSWKIPAGVIDNMTELLESHQIPVLSFDFKTERVDSRLILTKENYPLIFLNKSLLGDRLRFSLAYELGHLIIHAYSNPSFERNTNHEANIFAAEFLMPEKDIRPDFKDGVTVAKLAELKRKWKVSMHALLFRAEDLGFITYNQKTYILTQFNQLQIRRREPAELDIPIEKPVLIRDLFVKYRKVQRMTIKQLAEYLHLQEEEFLRMYAE
jgi:Zn-dependent peptidase ImmA (M78 family)/DNA-binding XRE family transcriptional regulator